MESKYKILCENGEQIKWKMDSVASGKIRKNHRKYKIDCKHNWRPKLE